jgi:glyoxylase-like metal-dependent hydrolase (beta-lactamase superfamily II)
MGTVAVRLIRSALVTGAALWLASCAAPPREDAAAVLARASQAMGASQLVTLRYSAEGTGYTFGQAYHAGGAWPKITVHSLTRSIDYAGAAMRDEVVLSRAEPLGGGGYPLSGQQRNDQFVSGELAWNQSGDNVTPSPRALVERVHQLWITPHGILKAARRGSATVDAGDAGASTVSFELPGRFSASATIGADGLVRRVDSIVPDPVLGDTAVATTYDDYREFGAIRFPMRIRQTMGGYPVLDLAVKEVQVNPALALAAPEAAGNVAERVTFEKVAEGVWFLAGGSHNSVLIELQDRLVLVETPLNDARTRAVIDQAKVLVPDKPIRTVVNSHQHFDHAGGVRSAVAEGATIVTHADNMAYFEAAFLQANRILPDAMARSGKKAVFQPLTDRLEIGDARRPIEVHRIVGGPHSESIVMVYLPGERLLIEADAFTPPAPNTPPPAVANANNVNLVDNIERLKLAVDRILPLHGRVVPSSELYAATRRTPPR